jgi:hypothetical protein
MPVYFGSLEIASISTATALMMPGITLPIASKRSGDNNPGVLRVMRSLLVLLGVSVPLGGFVAVVLGTATVAWWRFALGLPLRGFALL